MLEITSKHRSQTRVRVCVCRRILILLPSDDTVSTQSNKAAVRANCSQSSTKWVWMKQRQYQLANSKQKSIKKRYPFFPWSHTGRWIKQVSFGDSWVHVSCTQKTESTSLEASITNQLWAQVEHANWPKQKQQSDGPTAFNMANLATLASY